MNVFMKWRWLWAALIAALLMLGIPSLQKAIVPNNALTVWFLESDEMLINYKKFQDLFGNDETISILVVDSQGVINARRIEQIRRLTRSLEKIDGVARVFSLTNVSDLKLIGTDVSFENPIPHDSPTDPSRWIEIKNDLVHSSLLVNRFVDSTATATMVYVQMASMENFDAKRDAIVASVKSVAEEILGSGNAHIGGLGVVYSGLNQITSHDFGLFLGLSYVVMFAVIYFIFRRVVLVLISLSGVFLASILTLECYGLMGYQVNMLTMTIPTITVILAILDSLHMIHEYYVQSRNAAPQTKPVVTVTSALKTVFVPCLFTTLTTVAGLISFVFSPMAVLREFGWFSSLGIMLAFVCSYVFAAVALPFIRFSEETFFEKSFFKNSMTRLFENLYHRPAKYVLLIVILCVISVFGMIRIKVDTYTIKYLPDDHPVVQDHEFIRSHWGDYLTLEYLITPVQTDALSDPKFLTVMESFEDDCRKLPEIHNAMGIHSLRKRIIEQVPNEYKSYASRLSISKRDLPLAQRPLFADSSFRIARLTLTGSMMSARHLDDLLARVDSISQKHFKGIATIEATGYPPLYARIIDYVTTSQIQSFYLALIMIYALMVFLLRSFKLATISLIPNVLPILFLFGAMGLLNLTLDIATATTAAIVLGFSIDDTIHFMVHYQRSGEQGQFERLRDTFSHSIDALILNSLILFIGYSVLLLASVKTVYYFGLLTMIAIAGGLVAEILVLPILLKTFDSPKSKRGDV